MVIIAADENRLNTVFIGNFLAFGSFEINASFIGKILMFDFEEAPTEPGKLEFIFSYKQDARTGLEIDMFRSMTAFKNFVF